MEPRPLDDEPEHPRLQVAFEHREVLDRDQRFRARVDSVEMGRLLPQRLRSMGFSREVCCPSSWATPMRIPSGLRM